MIYFQIFSSVKALFGVFFQHNRNDISTPSRKILCLFLISDSLTPHPQPPPHTLHTHLPPPGNLTASLIPHITCGKWPPPFGNQFHPLPPHQMLSPKHLCGKMILRCSLLTPQMTDVSLPHHPVKLWLFVLLPCISDECQSL